MKELIEALSFDATCGMERRVSQYHPFNVRAEVVLDEYVRRDYEEETEDVLQDAMHEALMSELREYA